MPIDPSVALGAPIPSFTTTWDADDVILYHLGIGAGLGRPTDPAELAYTYEQRLAVLPSFGVIPAFPGLLTAFSGEVPGLAIDPALGLHGEQDLEIHQPIPTSGSVENRPRVAAAVRQGQRRGRRHRGRVGTGRRPALHQSVHGLRPGRRRLRRRPELPRSAERAARPRARRRGRIPHDEAPGPHLPPVGG